MGRHHNNISTYPLTRLLFLVAIVSGFERKPCRRQDRVQFQFPDCYVPPMDTSQLLSSASFLMSHDAASGYIQSNKLSGGALTASYAKTQIGTVYDQLNDGARALDLRPKLLTDGTVVFQHGDITINVSYEQLLSDAVRWCNDNPDELVLILPSHMAYEDSSSASSYEDSSDGGDYQYRAVNAMASIYASYNVPYYDCGSVYGLTVAETMELAALPSDGGYLMALDGQDYSTSFCGKSNWVEDDIVTCYPQNVNPNIKCTNGRKSIPLSVLTEYVLASANNEATDDAYTLGPPVSLEETPFNEIQALWQIDTYSAAMGITHLSTLLNDNRQSQVNAAMVKLIHNGNFSSISLFAVDNVALNGNALLSVLRTRCGQSTLSSDECGSEIGMPRMSYVNMSKLVYCLVLSMILAVVARGILKRKEHSEIKR